MSKTTNSDEIMKIIIAKLDKIENKVDRLDERLDSSEKVAIKQESNLELHMRRSDMLEKSHDALYLQVSPLLKIHTVVWGICKIVSGIALVIGIIVGIIKIVTSI